MAGDKKWSLYLTLVVVAVALQGCELMGCSVTTGTTTSTTTVITHSSTTETTTTTQTTTSTKESAGHCTKFDSKDKDKCLVCEDAFNLVDGECFFNCETDKPLITVSNSAKKGMCLDDTTFQFCSDKIPHIWPNTKEPLTSLRLFSSWQTFWPDDNREEAWSHLVSNVKSNGMTVLVGTQITCNETADDQDWKQVLELLQKLGPDHIMGVAIGNELELLWQKSYASKECIDNMWDGGYFWEKTVSRIGDLDNLGSDYSKLPVTSVFGGAILGAEPFINTHQARVTTYLKNATNLYGSRWAFSLNVYPYLDPNVHLDPHSAHKCDESIKQATCLNKPDCLTTTILRVMRGKMKALTGNTDDIFWVGETGWSSPMASTLNTPVRNCPDFSSIQTFEMNYETFLEWDLTVGKDGSIKGPDHIFYFTMRDSSNFGFEEHFGLVGKCEDTKCKLQNGNSTSTNDGDDDWDRIVV
mmetsp:Transcript_16886/g.36337  ORF Transcript_16886/g.36337 Transcript_16886/m.36337 type:complete len:469 (-) Transcript_16886:392-1798(-)|eukprot:CAMPEP_0206455078 /NCGR_PEP_ID=MMETSP0324_2-20121206/21531_1 /ASSEMBLY_ACC=CAM_ASM_000836 /TAXON_ID=2866 /ORGANISM="Crypthecodinium cohnii, Strain Seligo" /LENGTH=468 /DNA_ID=CAMNT_0053925699 /DNA_START=113 /DNA_END=1519 /DNA_ORIENTATION=+